mgnify:CR=1 FL=1
MRKIKILSIIITVTIIFSTYVKALSEKIENEETNSITNTINENEPIEEPPAVENQTNVEPENNDYEPSYPSYNPPQYQEKKSENADLRVLKIENMEPEFSKDVTEYYLTVDLETDKINIEAYSSHSYYLCLRKFLSVTWSQLRNPILYQKKYLKLQ